jgi:hypothetical protein
MRRTDIGVDESEDFIVIKWMCQDRKGERRPNKAESIRAKDTSSYGTSDLISDAVKCRTLGMSAVLPYSPGHVCI